jgi:hypothetical protein
LLYGNPGLKYATPFGVGLISIHLSFTEH